MGGKGATLGRPLARARPQSFSDVFPHLVAATNVPKLVKIDDVDYSKVDAIFCCLPHATTQVRAANAGGQCRCTQAAAPQVPAAQLQSRGVAAAKLGGRGVQAAPGA